VPNMPGKVYAEEKSDSAPCEAQHRAANIVLQQMQLHNLEKRQAECPHAYEAPTQERRTEFKAGI